MFRRLTATLVIVTFCCTSIIGPQAKAAEVMSMTLPIPGAMVNLSPAFEPTLIKGLTVHKDNPFLFDFIIDTGNSGLSVGAGSPGLNKGEETSPLRIEADRLIKYFFACLTVPEKDLWVNLSPYEKDRMVPDALGKTALGRDLLAQDYILKQLTASLIYPEKDLGREFWNRVYAKAQAMYGNVQIPVNTFNKVWILADKADVYEHGQTAFVVGGHLKVMLEEDYLAAQKHNISPPFMGGVRGGQLSDNAPLPNPPHKGEGTNSIGSQIIRDIVLPEIEKEVNTGKNFAMLRQIFNAQILATWYKKNLKEALINQVYADKSTVKGVNLSDPSVKEQIYQQYLQAYKKGVFNYIKEDPQANGQTIPRKYFSGGYGSNLVVTVSQDPAMGAVAARPTGQDYTVKALLEFNKPNAVSSDAAMMAQEYKDELVLAIQNGIFKVGSDFISTHVSAVVSWREMEAKNILQYHVPNGHLFDEDGNVVDPILALKDFEEESILYQITYKDGSNNYVVIDRDDGPGVAVRINPAPSRSSQAEEPPKDPSNTKGKKSRRVLVGTAGSGPRDWSKKTDAAMAAGSDRLVKILTFSLISANIAGFTYIGITALESTRQAAKADERARLWMLNHSPSTEKILRYDVKSTDTIASIVALTGIDESILKEANGLTSDKDLTDIKILILPGITNYVFDAYANSESVEEISRLLYGSEMFSSRVFYEYRGRYTEHDPYTPQDGVKHFWGYFNESELKRFNEKVLPNLETRPDGLPRLRMKDNKPTPPTAIPDAAMANPQRINNIEELPNPYSFDVNIKNEAGLHNRPAMMISDLLNAFPELEAEANKKGESQLLDAKSMMMMRFLAASVGNTISFTIKAKGTGKEQMLRAAVALRILIEDIQFFEGDDNQGYKDINDLYNKVIAMPDEKLLEIANRSDAAMAGKKQVQQAPKLDQEINRENKRGLFYGALLTGKLRKPDERNLNVAGETIKRSLVLLEEMAEAVKQQERVDFLKEIAKANGLQYVEEITSKRIDVPVGRRTPGLPIKTESKVVPDQRIAGVEIPHGQSAKDVADQLSSWISKKLNGRFDAAMVTMTVEEFVKEVKAKKIKKDAIIDIKKNSDPLTMNKEPRRGVKLSHVDETNLYFFDPKYPTGSAPISMHLLGIETITVKRKDLAMTIDEIKKKVNEDQKVQTPGGIDLNSSNMGMTVTKDANGGVQVNFDPAMIARIKTQGVFSANPVIIQIAPMTPIQLRPLLGLAPAREEEEKLAKV